MSCSSSKIKTIAEYIELFKNQQKVINTLTLKLEELTNRIEELESRTLLEERYLTRAQVSKLIHLSKRTIKDNPAFKAIEIPIENTNRVLYSIEDLQILLEGY